LFALLIIGVIYVVFSLTKIDWESLKGIQIIMPALLTAISFQFLCSIIVVYTWQQCVVSSGFKKYRLLDSFRQYGYASIGKYVPGKLFGLIGRGALVHSQSKSLNVSVSSALKEQLALLHSGVSLCALFFLVNYSYYLWGGGLFCIVILSVIYMDKILSLSYLSRFSVTKGFSELQWSGYTKIYLLLSIVWILSAYSVYFCTNAVQPQSEFTVLQAVYVTSAAYIVGFIAIFIPGGLGVREGMFVLLLTPQFGVFSLAISIIYRAITVFLDLLFGLISILLSLRVIK